MPRLSITFISRHGWTGAVLAALVVLSLLVVISALPGLLFGTTLTPAEAETSIRGHLLTQAAMNFRQQTVSATPEEQQRLLIRYTTELESIQKRRFLSTDVDTVIFGFFSIRRSFVAEVVTAADTRQPTVRYYCFVGHYITGECSRWNWWLAW